MITSSNLLAVKNDPEHLEAGEARADHMESLRRKEMYIEQHSSSMEDFLQAYYIDDSHHTTTIVFEFHHLWNAQQNRSDQKHKGDSERVLEVIHFARIGDPINADRALT